MARLHYNRIGLNHRAHFYIAESFQQWAARRQLERMGALFFHIKFLVNRFLNFKLHGNVIAGVKV